MSLRTQLLSSLLLSSQLTGRTPQAAGQSAPSTFRTYELGDPGRPAPMPTLLIAIFDDSASVVGRAGNDPLSNRYGEARRAFTVVAAKGSRRELGAVVHFDTPRGDVAPVPLTRQGMRHIRGSLCIPRGAPGSSELGPSLHQATIYAKAYPQHTATLVVFSDLLLFDRDPSAVYHDLENFPGEVHLVVLGSCVTPMELDGRIAITHVDRSDPPGATARALFGSLVLHRPDSHVTS